MKTEEKEENSINLMLRQYYKIHNHTLIDSLTSLYSKYTPFYSEDIRDTIVNMLSLEDNHDEKMYIQKILYETEQFEGYKTLRQIMKLEDLQQLLHYLSIDYNSIEEEEGFREKRPIEISLIREEEQSSNTEEEEQSSTEQEESNNNVNPKINPDFLINSSYLLLKTTYNDQHIPELKKRDIPEDFSDACAKSGLDINIPLSVMEKLLPETEKEKGLETVRKVYDKGLETLQGIRRLQPILHKTDYRYLEKILNVHNESEYDDETDKSKKLSEFDKTFELIKQQSNLTYFKDQFNNPYIHIDNINIRLSSKSEKIQHYLIDLCWNSEYNFSPSPETINRVINVLASQATRHGETHSLELRCAQDPNNPYIWYYDMGDSTGRSIKITSRGWEIINNTPIIFRRYTYVGGEQVEPKRNYNPDIFDKILESYFYITDEKLKLLLKIYIISLFIPKIQKPFLMFGGVQDSGKTSKQQFIKMIVDPNPILTHFLPKNDLDAIVQTVSHNYVVFWENISGISPEVADLFCIIITGGGKLKRTLFTDDDDHITKLQSIIGCNSINLGTNRGDLISRSINITFKGIDDEKRRDPEELMEEFISLKPYLLGYIFDTLVQLLKLKEEGTEVELTKFNRMIQFQKNGELISKIINDKGEYTLTEIYDELIQNQNIELVEEDEISKSIIYVSERGTTRYGMWKGNMTQLLNAIKDHINTQGIQYDRIVEFPKSSNKLSNKIRRITPTLEKLGIYILKYTEDNTKIIEIRNINILGKEEEQTLKKFMSTHKTD